MGERNTSGKEATQQEIKIRIKLAHQYLIRKLQTGPWIKGFSNKSEAAPIGLQLQAFSSLVSCVPTYISVAKHGAKNIGDLYSLKWNDHAIVTNADGYADTQCTALFGHLLLKFYQAGIDIGYSPLPYFEAVTQCITDKIQKFPPGTYDDAIVAHNPGTIILPLICAAQIFQNDKFMDAAERACLMMYDYKRVGTHDSLAFGSMHGIKPNPRFYHYLDRLHETLDLNISSFVGVAIPVYLQTLITWQEIVPNNSVIQRRIKNIYDLLIKHQIYDSNDDDYGAFFKEPADKEIRVDYLFLNANALNMYHRWLDGIPVLKEPTILL